jgi:hypothetical protein
LRNTQAAKEKREQRVAEGKCIWCGEPRGESTSTIYCEEHLLAIRTASRNRMRKKTGCKPWRPGGRGRPPIERSEA